MANQSKGGNTMGGFSEFSPGAFNPNDTPWKMPGMDSTPTWTNGGPGKSANMMQGAADPISQGPALEQGPMGGNRLGEFDPSSLTGGGLPSHLRDPFSGGSGVSFSYSQPSYTPNPYLAQQAEAIKTGFNRNLQEQVLPGLREKFVGSGGLGGSRQGIAEGLAAARSGEGLANAITNLYSSDYENSQNRALQGSIANMNSGLQARNMELQDQMNRLNSERNFYSTNRGQDLQQLGLAAGLLGQANQGFLGQGQGTYQTGLLEQQAPWTQLGNFSNTIGPFAQAGATNSGTQSYSYNPTQQWLGLGLQAASIFSDVRLKENIKRVGETDDGLGVYTYNYKGDDTPQMGVMAQEVAVKKPEALGPTVNGFMSVRYGLLGD